MEFGAKLDVSIDEEGCGRLEKVSFDAYNEGGCQKGRGTEVYCIGCDVTVRAPDIAEKFHKTLKEDNINLTILNILADTDKM